MRQRIDNSPIVPWLEAEPKCRLVALMWDGHQTAGRESAWFVAMLIQRRRTITYLVPGREVHWRHPKGHKIKVYFGVNWDHFIDVLGKRRFDTVWTEDYLSGPHCRRQPAWRERLVSLHRPARTGYGYDITEKIQEGVPLDPYAPDAVLPLLVPADPGVPVRYGKQQRAEAIGELYRNDFFIRSPLRQWEDELTNWHQSGTKPDVGDAFAWQQKGSQIQVESKRSEAGRLSAFDVPDQI